RRTTRRLTGGRRLQRGRAYVVHMSSDTDARRNELRGLDAHQRLVLILREREPDVPRDAVARASVGVQAPCGDSIAIDAHGEIVLRRAVRWGDVDEDLVDVVARAAAHRDLAAHLGRGALTGEIVLRLVAVDGNPRAVLLLLGDGVRHLLTARVDVGRLIGAVPIPAAPDRQD